ncbi:ABC transporter substrate-binding protein [Kineococcus esterisolvens]|uniref:ABC transporter substrate-binding protein n=1 Tax=unclassified Kineococcus TaxID=2621656 RepID=UPI003D7C5D2E
MRSPGAANASVGSAPGGDGTAHGAGAAREREVRRPRELRRLLAAGVAAVLLAGCGGASGTPGDGGDVVLDFAWWGDKTRAERYEQAVALFEEANPGVDVRTRYASWGDYWTARNTEAAGGQLPDVFQMDIAYLTDYAGSGRIAPLDEHVGEGIDLSALPESLLPSARVDGQTYAVPTSTNTLTTVVNTDLLGELGVPLPDEDTTWDEYDTFLADVAAAGASRTPPVHGSNDYTHVVWLFHIWLGQQGKSMFQDGELGFTEADLAEWWGRARALHENGAFLPPQRVEQIEGADSIGLGETAAEISWDNFLVRFSEGSGGAAMTLLPPPADDPDERGMFLKPSLMLAMGAGTEHPEEAAALIDFITNDPQVGAVFGMSRGVPASATALEGFEPAGLDQQILAYEESLEPYLTSSPPPPVAGFGSLETAFTRIGQDLAHGSISVDEAVEQWFTEAESALQQ